MAAVLDKKPFPVSTRTLSNTEIYAIPAYVFETMMKTYPAFSRDARRTRDITRPSETTASANASVWNKNASPTPIFSKPWRHYRIIFSRPSRFTIRPP
jgi:hypothetical protein